MFSFRHTYNDEIFEIAKEHIACQITRFKISAEAWNYNF